MKIKMTKKHIVESIFYHEKIKKSNFVTVPLSFFEDYMKCAFESYYKDVVYEEYQTWPAFYGKMTENFDLSKPIKYHFNNDLNCYEYVFQSKSS